jgi:hypothetical protein
LHVIQGNGPLPRSTGVNDDVAALHPSPRVRQLLPGRQVDVVLRQGGGGGGGGDGCVGKRGGAGSREGRGQSHVLPHHALQPGGGRAVGTPALSLLTATRMLASTEVGSLPT